MKTPAEKCAERIEFVFKTMNPCPEREAAIVKVITAEYALILKEAREAMIIARGALKQIHSECPRCYGQNGTHLAGCCIGIASETLRTALAKLEALTRNQNHERRSNCKDS